MAELLRPAEPQVMWCWMHLGTLQLDASKLVPLQVSLPVHSLMTLMKISVCSETQMVNGLIVFVCPAWTCMDELVHDESG